MRAFTGPGVGALIASMTSAGGAAAQPANPLTSPAAPSTSASPSPAPSPRPAPAPSPKRPLPDYDGRGAAPPSTGEIALWVPRVILSPLYLTTEFLIRRPLGAAVSAAERANLPEVLYNFFAFGPNHEAGIVPIAFVDFGFNPSVGLYGFWDNATFKGNDLRVHASLWTDDWIGGSVADRVAFGNGDSVQLKFVGIRRPDHVFYGVGPSSLESAQSRYSQDMLDVGMLFDFPLWRSSKIDTSIGVRSSTFHNGHFGHDPGIVQSAAAGTFPLPDGFDRGYTAEYNNVLVAIDSRQKYPAEGSGVRVELHAEQGNDVRQAPASGWLHYTAGLGGYWDVNGNRRVVSLTLLTMFSDPLGPRPVPFTELVTLGGDIASHGSFPAPMLGFYPGRLVDRSAAVATLRYKWPIGPWIAGSLQGAVGNVFGPHLEGYDTNLLRFSGAVGIESDSSVDSSFELVFGMGTETFAHGTQFDSIHLAFGVTRF
jgi:hypothetical protein